MNVKDKMELYRNTPADERPKTNIRRELRIRMAEEGISQRQMALYLGMTPQNFSNFLTGKVPMPLERLMHLMWLLEPNGDGGDEICTRCESDIRNVLEWANETSGLRDRSHDRTKTYEEGLLAMYKWLSGSEASDPRL